jgi:hypothetical protein
MRCGMHHRLVTAYAAECLAQGGVRRRRKRTDCPEHCASNACMKHRFQVNFLRGESARDPHSDRERRIRGVLLDRRTPLLQSRRERLRECVYGVVARNFSEGKALSQSFGGESKPAWQQGPFDLWNRCQYPQCIHVDLPYGSRFKRTASAQASATAKKL